MLTPKRPPEMSAIVEAIRARMAGGIVSTATAERPQCHGRGADDPNRSMIQRQLDHLIGGEAKPATGLREQPRSGVP
jgi:hypothetical protein